MHITESCDYVLCISGYVQSLVILPGVFQICRQKNGKNEKKFWNCTGIVYFTVYCGCRTENLTKFYILLICK